MKGYLMNNFDRIRQMSEKEFVEWLEDFAETYVSFWIMPDGCDFSHRDEDKKIQFQMLKSDYIDDRIFEF